MIAVEFQRIEFIDTARERFGAVLLLQASWKEPKLDNVVRICAD